jgi:hypothetical protein
MTKNLKAVKKQRDSSLTLRMTVARRQKLWSPNYKGVPNYRTAITMKGGEYD